MNLRCRVTHTRREQCGGDEIRRLIARVAPKDSQRITRGASHRIDHGETRESERLEQEGSVFAAPHCGVETNAFALRIPSVISLLRAGRSDSRYQSWCCRRMRMRISLSFPRAKERMLFFLLFYVFGRTSTSTYDCDVSLGFGLRRVMSPCNALILALQACSVELLGTHEGTYQACTPGRESRDERG